MKNNLLTQNETIAFEIAKQAVFVHYNYKQTIMDIKEELRCSLYEAKESLDGLLKKEYVRLNEAGKIVFV